MFHDNAPESVVLPFIHAEEDTSFVDAITAHEQSQKSIGDVEPMNPGDNDGAGISHRKGASRSPEPALRRTEAQASSEAFESTLLDEIEKTRPLMTDKERAEFEEARARTEEAEEEAEEELEEVEEIDEEEGEPNPLDSFDPNLVAQFAEKFGLTEKDLTDSRIANMLADRLGEQQDQQTQDAVQQRQPQTEQEHYHAYMSELQRVAADPQINDPVMMAAFENTLAQCFGVGPEDTPAAKANIKNLSGALVQGGLSLMSTVVPAMMNHYFAQALEATLPGLAQNHFDAIVHNTWADVRQDPQFADLPADINSPEMEELRQKVLAANPWMTTITFKDEQGRNLHPDHPKAIRQQAALFARLCTGERLTPEMVKQAVEKGRKEAQSHGRRVSASRSLGSGRRSAGGAFGSNAKDESFSDSIREYMASLRSGEQG